MIACNKTALGIAIGNGQSHMVAGELDGSFGVFISAWFCEHLSQQALMQLAGSTMLPIMQT